MGSRRDIKDIEQYLEEAVKNIREDRAITSMLLTDLINYLKVSDERHREAGSVAAKYVETLQRSNEQLVKVAALIQKDNVKEAGLTAQDKQEIFDILNSEDE
tara:strand:+ start:418 stop:723 length:306 start_codon:yes stop_codon:yes gene_type:complete